MKNPVRRSEFTELGKAARLLLKALEPLLQNDVPRARLLVRMQEVDGCTRAQAHYYDALMAMYDPLFGLVNAAKAEVGGPGGSVDPWTARWVLIAAEQWQLCTGKPPSYAAEGSFFCALAAFQLEHHALPKVTARTLRTVLKASRKTN